MKPRVLVLGAGFAGLELATSLSETQGDRVDITVIDKSEALIAAFEERGIEYLPTTTRYGW